jgi:hypothetical protein
MNTEFLVQRAELYVQLFEFNKSFAERLNLTLNVESNDLSSGRRVIGEIKLIAAYNYKSVNDTDEYHGSWAFHTRDRFSATIQLTPEKLLRLWQIWSSQPQWFLISIEHGPPTPKFDTEFSGPFRLSYRAGAERQL